MIINKINNNNRVADIRDWKKRPVTWDDFQRKQTKLKHWNFVLHPELTSATNLCPECQCRQSSLTYVYDDGKNCLEFCFEVCVSCWQVSELIPVYDVRDEYKSDKDYSVLLPAIQNHDYKLAMMILDIFME